MRDSTPPVRWRSGEEEEEEEEEKTEAVREGASSKVIISTGVL
jgi:hypothetical protein